MLVPSSETGGASAQIVLPDTAFATFYRLDRETVGAILGEEPEGMYLQILPAESGSAAPELPLAVDPPPLDEGSHASYAFQWFSFATIAVVGFFVVVIRRRKHLDPPGP
jgi:surfeit locus 1 family protein